VKEQGRPWKLRFGKVFEPAYPFMLHIHGQIGLPAPWQVVLEPQKSIRDSTKEMVSALLGAGEILSIGCISSPYGPIWGFLG